MGDTIDCSRDASRIKIRRERRMRAKSSSGAHVDNMPREIGEHLKG